MSVIINFKPAVLFIFLVLTFSPIQNGVNGINCYACISTPDFNCAKAINMNSTICRGIKNVCSTIFIIEDNKLIGVRRECSTYELIGVHMPMGSCKNLQRTPQMVLKMCICDKDDCNSDPPPKIMDSSNNKSSPNNSSTQHIHDGWSFFLQILILMIISSYGLGVIIQF